MSDPKVQTVEDLIQKYLALEGRYTTRNTDGKTVLATLDETTADDLIHYHLERGGISVTRDESGHAVAVSPDRRI